MAFLDDKELADSYQDARKKARYFFEPFDEFERLANNKIRSDLPGNMPKVNDGSLAAMLMETPMRVLPTMQSGKVKLLDRDEPWLTELANIRWNRYIIPKANTQAPFFTKEQMALYRALQYGSCPTFSFFGENGADWTIPYIRNVYLEPGKVSDLDSQYIWMDNWYTKLQIKSIIKSSEEEERLAKVEKRKTNSPWIVKKLKELLDKTEDKDSQNRTPEERKHAITDGLYKISFCFQRGIDAPFKAIAPALGDEIIWEKTNINPTGDVPVIFLYAFQDLSNPYGRGQIEISGATQNVLDYLTQSHVLSTQIGLQPPVIISGQRSDVNLNSIVYAPRAFWFTGSGGKVDQVNTNTEIYTQFGQNYGLYKTQLQNLQGTTDATVSGESGNPQYSKTDAGVKLQQERTSAHDNYLAERVNEWFERQAKNLINLDFANMQGQDVMKLLDDERERMESAGIEMPTNELTVIWDNVRASFDFEVERDESPEEQNEAEKQSLTEAISIIQQSPTIDQDLAADGERINRGELWKGVLTRLKLPNTEKILVKITPEEQQAMQEQEAMAAQAGVGPDGQPPDPNAPQPEAMPPEATEGQPDGSLQGLPLAEEEMPMEEPMPEEGPDPEELQITMEQYEVDEPTALLLMQARAMGIPEQAIYEYVTEGQGAVNG